MGLKRFPVSLHELFYLYLCQDRHLFNQYVVLEDEEIQMLNQMILAYLTRFTELQHYQRLEHALKNALPLELTEEQRADLLSKVSELMDSKRSFVPSEDSILLLFEYFENKRIFPKQYKYIHDLSTPGPQGIKNQSAQLIMGGGKTSLIIPLLALKMADGKRLSVVEVPSALFNVNLNDLNETTFKLCKKAAHPFLFDDTIDCSVAYLKNLRNRLQAIILNREYLVTTRESMQSFELKYFRTLRFSQDNKVNNRRIELFDEIDRLFQVSNGLLDEVDSTLSVKKQLIQVVGKGDPVPEHEIEIILDLFEYIQSIEVSNIVAPDKSIKILVRDILEERVTPSNQHWPHIITKLVDNLFTEKNSPLRQVLQQCDGEETKQLKAYILGVSTEYPVFIERFDLKLCDLIVLYKEQFSTKLDASNLLTLCFQKSIDEEIGLSRDYKNKSGFELELSIPYLANNVPNETARHGHYLETLNHTIKIKQNKSLSLGVVKSMIDAYIERLDKAMGPNGSPKMYDGVITEFKILTQENLTEIEINDKAAFQKFYDRVKDLNAVKRHCLQYHILNYIEKNGFTIRSDAQTHAAQFGSIQGVTGTNWNYRCHPHGMTADLEASRGIDGQTIDHLMRHPQKPLLLDKLDHVVQDTMQSLVPKMATQASSHIHAWIDLGAFFKGVSNEKIADQFADYFLSKEFQKTSDKKYRYVLFFDQANKLWALNLKDRSLVYLKSTNYEYTQERLNCKPEEWFTYYDQIHGTGTDIIQASRGYALVPLGLKTIERDVLQAVMRMRLLKHKQRIIFVISKEIQDAYPHVSLDSWDVMTIVDICVENQIKRLSFDHYTSTIQKLRNELRKDCKKRKSNAPDVAIKRQLSKIFEGVFFSKTEKSAFLQFKQITTMEDTLLVLEKMVKEIFDRWLFLMKEAQVSLMPKEISDFERRLRSIAAEMLPVCLDKVTQPDNSDGLRETEVNIEKDRNTEQEQEVECDTELQSKTQGHPLKRKRWGFLNFKNWNMEPHAVKHFIVLDTLEAMAQTHVLVNEPATRKWAFSPDILVTENYRDTCENQPSKLDYYKKEALFVLMIQDDIKETLKCLVITPEEAVYFRPLVLNPDKRSQSYAWIETIHQTKRCGEKPKEADLHKNYGSILEQLALMNCDMDVLLQALNTNGKNSWLIEEADAKIEFLERCIMPIHKDKPNLSILLKQKIVSMEVQPMQTHMYKLHKEKSDEGVRSGHRQISLVPL